MSEGIFITGTDTGVGKTTVSCAAACGVRHAGLRAEHEARRGRRRRR